MTDRQWLKLAEWFGLAVGAVCMAVNVIVLVMGLITGDRHSIAINGVAATIIAAISLLLYKMSRYLDQSSAEHALLMQKYIVDVQTAEAMLKRMADSDLEVRSTVTTERRH